ncbi:MAG: antitoxin [Nitrospirae bacterium]|nr:MAG: antitoxin [Nitrospirota bacterium]
MQTKLTLRLDEELIRRAKVYAQRRGTSLSRIVAQYFALLDEPAPSEGVGETRLVRELRGSLRGAEVDEADYRRYLEGRYL